MKSYNEQLNEIRSNVIKDVKKLGNKVFFKGEKDELWDVISDIQEYITDKYPGFDKCSRWDGRETHIILEGYGTEIGLSEYCGLATLSVRVDEGPLEYSMDDQEYEADRQKALNWIRDNWDQASEYWNQYRKIGTFSNGESVYEKTN